MLKFLEEPEENITAILLTKNKHAVISTIMSRCININLIKKEYINIDSEDLSYKFVEILEMYKEKALPHLYLLLVKKIEALNKNTDYLRYNVNIKTILDKIVIEVYGGDF